MKNDWVEEAHEELLEERGKKNSITYSELLHPDDIFDKECERIKVTTADGKSHYFIPDDITELNGLAVKIERGRTMMVIPLDKILYAEYLY